MGLIKAFQELFVQSLLINGKNILFVTVWLKETLLQLGRKRINTTNYQSSNTKGSEHIITQDSLLVVNERSGNDCDRARENN